MYTHLGNESNVLRRHSRVEFIQFGQDFVMFVEHLLNLQHTQPIFYLPYLSISLSISLPFRSLSLSPFIGILRFKCGEAYRYETQHELKL